MTRPEPAGAGTAEMIGQREIVMQRTPTDCTVCCLAMATGRTYEDVLTAIGDVFDPEKGMRREDQALQRLGFGDSLFAKMVRDWCISYEGFRALAWGRRAIISVPSLNYPDLWHSVWWDGERVFDPSPGTQYLTWDDLRPEEIIIFRESIIARSAITAAESRAMERCAKIAEAQPYYPDTNVGMRQRWVKDQIAAAIRSSINPSGEEE